MPLNPPEGGPWAAPFAGPAYPPGTGPGPGALDTGPSGPAGPAFAPGPPPPPGAYPGAPPTAPTAYPGAPGGPGAGWAGGPGDPSQGWPGGPAAPPAPKKKRRGLLIGAVTAAALVVGAGGVYAVTSLRGVGGASSPEQAVEKIIKDAASMDLVRTASHVAPSERAAVESWVEPLKGWLDDAAARDESSVKAFEAASQALKIEVKDLEFTSEPLALDIQRTAVTGGSISVDADSDQLTDAVMDLMESNGSLSSLTGGSPLGRVYTRSEVKEQIDKELPFTKEIKPLDDLFLVTVKEDGKWFTSLTMTAAQYAFEDSGYSNAALGSPLPEEEMMGADKAQDAIGQLVKAIDATSQSGDLRDLARAMPVAESRLLAVYGPAVAEPEAVRETFSLFKVTDAKTSEFKTFGSSALVSLDSLVVELVTGGPVSLVRDGQKWRLQGEFDSKAIDATVTQPDPAIITFDGAYQDEYSDRELVGTIEVTSPGELALDAETGEGGIYFKAGGECVEFKIMGMSQELCDSSIGEALAQAGFDQLKELPDLKGLIALTAVKGAGGKWYISAFSPAVMLAAAGAGAVSGLSNMARPFGGGMGGLGGLGGLESDFPDGWEDFDLDEDFNWEDEFGLDEDWDEDFDWGDEPEVDETSYTLAR
ncbi:MAG: hypothetical protein LBL01_04955 [Bifidobacteriaceae bacterium]|nr:hypothetical protein [Bifidobacteriaceae bacterium]